MKIQIPKTSLRYLILVIGIFFIYSAYQTKVDAKQSLSLDSVSTTAFISDSASTPSRLTIPDLNIDANIQPVGVDDSYSIFVPEKDYAGWYKHSSKPSQLGSTVIAGHVDFNGSKAVFYELNTIKLNSLISIKTEEGTIKYKVSNIKNYNKNYLPAKVIFSKTGKNRLYLVTCSGKFNQKEQSYSDNLVVEALPIAS